MVRALRVRNDGEIIRLAGLTEELRNERTRAATSMGLVECGD
jgi:hypothetical protein